jgi:hypothetical protein
MFKSWYLPNTHWSRLVGMHWSNNCDMIIGSDSARFSSVFKRQNQPAQSIIFLPMPHSQCSHFLTLVLFHTYIQSILYAREHVPRVHSATWFGTNAMPVLEGLAYWPHTNDSLGGRIWQVKAWRWALPEYEGSSTSGQILIPGYSPVWGP